MTRVRDNAEPCRLPGQPATAAAYPLHFEMRTEKRSYEIQPTRTSSHKHHHRTPDHLPIRRKQFCQNGRRLNEDTHNMSRKQPWLKRRIVRVFVRYHTA